MRFSVVAKGRGVYLDDSTTTGTLDFWQPKFNRLAYNMAKHILLCLSLLSLSRLAYCVRTQLSINHFYNAPVSATVDSLPITDCTNEDSFIIQAYEDALDLAQEARDVLGDINRRNSFTMFYNELFTDTVRNKRPSAMSVSGKTQRCYSLRISAHC